jgi:deoxyribodipyrimidine photolyase-related protein
MMALRLVLADQLTHSLSSLATLNLQTDTVLLCEVMEEATYVKHHKKKIAFLFAAMRHFAQELTEQGVSVRYVKLDDPHNTGSFTGEVQRALAALEETIVIVTEPSEYRVLAMIKAWQEQLGVKVELLPDTRFLATREDFSAWAKGKKQLRMEFFYRIMRKKHHLLLDEAEKPIGGDWNYDKENRKPPKAGMRFPARLSHPKSSIVKEVLALVHGRFSDHFGTLEPFHYAVTRS